MWEKYFMNKRNTESELSGVIDELRKILKSVAEKYDLMIVED